MELSGNRIAVLVEQMYQEMELWYPVYRLREAGARVTIIGPEAGKVYNSKTGYPARSDRAANEVSAASFEAIIIPGGFAPDYLRRNPTIVQLIKDANAQGKVIGAICHAGWLLCTADIVRERRVTSSHSIKTDMVNAGAKWSDQGVVCDGNLITSRRTDDLPDFCRQIIISLNSGVTLNV
jgi:protease I